MVMTNGGMAARVAHSMGGRGTLQQATRGSSQQTRMAIRNLADAGLKRVPEVLGQKATREGTASQVKQMIADVLVKTAR